VNGPETAPAGIFTFKVEEVAEVTVNFTPPKSTKLLAAVLLKPEPLIVTTVPVSPFMGEMEVIVVCAFAEMVNASKNKSGKKQEVKKRENRDWFGDCGVEVCIKKNFMDAYPDEK